jgi:hypothetical protein
VHKGGTHVVRYRLANTSAEQMSKDQVAKHDSNPPTVTNSFLREGEHWIGVKKKGLCCLKVDSAWGAQPVPKEAQP